MNIVDHTNRACRTLFFMLITAVMLIIAAYHLALNANKNPQLETQTHPTMNVEEQKAGKP